MNATPDIQETTPISCVKVSPEEADLKMRETTQKELTKLAELMKTQKLPVREDIIESDEEESSCDSESEDDEDYVPTKRKRTSKEHNGYVSVESKMYQDNQKLWKRIHKYGIELNKTHKELHYMQLELNNKHIECEEEKSKSNTVDIYQKSNKQIKQELKRIYFFNFIYQLTIICFLLDYSSSHVFFRLSRHFCITYAKMFFEFCVSINHKFL
jgi:hypothetical protein